MWYCFRLGGIFQSPIQFRTHWSLGMWRSGKQRPTAGNKKVASQRSRTAEMRQIECGRLVRPSRQIFAGTGRSATVQPKPDMICFRNGGYDIFTLNIMFVLIYWQAKLNLFQIRRSRISYLIVSIEVKYQYYIII